MDPTPPVASARPLSSNMRSRRRIFFDPRGVRARDPHGRGYARASTTLFARSSWNCALVRRRDNLRRAVGYLGLSRDTKWPPRPLTMDRSSESTSTAARSWAARAAARMVGDGRHARRLGINALFCIGGDGTTAARTACRRNRAPRPAESVIGIPKPMTTTSRWSSAVSVSRRPSRRRCASSPARTRRPRAPRTASRSSSSWGASPARSRPTPRWPAATSTTASSPSCRSRSMATTACSSTCAAACRAACTRSFAWPRAPASTSSARPATATPRATSSSTTSACF